MPSDPPFFLPYQIAWIEDPAPLKIIQKSRQIGITWADAYDSVRKAGHRGARLDVWISSRDEAQAKLYIQDARKWAAFLQLAVLDRGLVVFDPKNNFSAYVLQFASGRRIYCLSSNPNALAGKRGHVKLDEFALHQDQRLLYQVAKPVTTWGGTLSIISTHRGARTVFNEIIRDIQEHHNPMGWSLHTVPVETAIGQGLVERINQKSGANESRESFLARLRAECIDEEQWLQEYCCLPADESAAFISYEMISSCEDPALTLSHSSHLSYPSHSLLYLGVDVARKKDLCVLDLGEKIGDVTWDRLRIELQNKTFSEIKFELWRLLRMTQLKRCCIDASGLGMQLAEEAKAAFGWKVEPITFTAPIKEELAFELRADFEDRRLRIVADDKLRADLRGIKKEVTSSNNLRFVGESQDSHCDRFWAKALRQHAARQPWDLGVTLG